MAIASDQAVGGKCRSHQETALLNNLEGILRTTGLESTPAIAEV
jgi:hypothetical protein